MSFFTRIFHCWYRLHGGQTNHITISPAALHELMDRFKAHTTHADTRLLQNMSGSTRGMCKYDCNWHLLCDISFKVSSQSAKQWRASIMVYWCCVYLMLINARESREIFPMKYFHETCFHIYLIQVAKLMYILYGIVKEFVSSTVGAKIHRNHLEKIAENWGEMNAYLLVFLLTLYQRWVLLSWSGVGVRGTSRETCCSLASSTLKEVTFLVTALQGYACTLPPWGSGGLLAPWMETVVLMGSTKRTSQ